ncbi:hypothetical protein GCM10007420_07210 [Glycocaulis albus]|uniref:Uncharacterized protein n=1 Tax=Glycocaulis albus TaxID=1382801 RepID=A0ABQ1XI96_9PROT|nr:hypothetical protein GCM10007420_07210 [Glycocaulis albus]
MRHMLLRLGRHDEGQAQIGSGGHGRGGPCLWFDKPSFSPQMRPCRIDLADFLNLRAIFALQTLDRWHSVRKNAGKGPVSHRIRRHSGPNANNWPFAYHKSPLFMPSNAPVHIPIRAETAPVRTPP